MNGPAFSVLLSRWLRPKSPDWRLCVVGRAAPDCQEHTRPLRAARPPQEVWGAERLAGSRGEHEMITGQHGSHLVDQECRYHDRARSMRLWGAPYELAVDQGCRFPHMNSAPQYVYVVGPERHGLSPAKATVGEELDQRCAATHSSLHRMGQLGHLLGGQISLIPFARLRYLHRLCRIPPDEAVVDCLRQYRRDHPFCLAHPGRR